MCAPSIRNMHLTQEIKRRQQDELLRKIALKHLMVNRILEGRALWGDGWTAWYEKFIDAFPENVSMQEIYDGLVLEIERRRAFPNSISQAEALTEITP